jgi:hypothetical protein
MRSLWERVLSMRTEKGTRMDKASLPEFAVCEICEAGEPVKIVRKARKMGFGLVDLLDCGHFQVPSA